MQHGGDTSPRGHHFPFAQKPAIVGGRQGQSRELAADGKMRPRGGRARHQAVGSWKGVVGGRHAVQRQHMGGR